MKPIVPWPPSDRPTILLLGCLGVVRSPSLEASAGSKTVKIVASFGAMSWSIWPRTAWRTPSRGFTRTQAEVEKRDRPEKNQGRSR